MKYNRILRKLPHVASNISAFRALFHPLTLSDKECTELLAPQLKSLPNHRDYYTNLASMGDPLLEIQLNDYLGTQNVIITPAILDQFSAANYLDRLLLVTPGFKAGPQDSIDLIRQTIAAVNLGISPYAATQVAKNICKGTNGLANTYIYSW